MWGQMLNTSCYKDKCERLWGTRIECMNVKEQMHYAICIWHRQSFNLLYIYSIYIIHVGVRRKKEWFKLQNYLILCGSEFLIFVFPLPHHLTYNLKTLPFTSQHIEFNPKLCILILSTCHTFPYIYIY